MNRQDQRKEFFGTGLAVGLLCAGLGILAWQSYHYLRFGIWHPASLIDVLRGLGLQWAAQPRSWTGLHQVLDWTPTSLALGLLGVGLLEIGDRSAKRR